jgi:hypothetical protein
MSDSGNTKPTASVPIFVGNGPAVDIAAEFYLAIAEWMLRDDGALSLHVPLPGEMSAWIAGLAEKEVQFGRSTVSERDTGAVQKEVMREAFAIMADPQKKEEMQLLGLLGAIPKGAFSQVLEALRKNDKSSLDEARASIDKSILEEFQKSISPEKIAALGGLVARTRAAQAVALSMVLYKKHPLSLIAKARAGDPQAVLQLIKIDKLFLSDSCCSHVIRQAEFGINRVFFKRLAKALTYKPTIGWRQGCKLYMYVLLASPVQLPGLTRLWARIDPDGNRFKTIGAFEKFVERCRKELKTLQQALPPSQLP